MSVLKAGWLADTFAFQSLPLSHPTRSFCHWHHVLRGDLGSDVVDGAQDVTPTVGQVGDQ